MANQKETVEVVHEALIRHWQPLREWLNQDRRFRLWQNDLRRNLASWEQTGKDEGGFLCKKMDDAKPDRSSRPVKFSEACNWNSPVLWAIEDFQLISPKERCVTLR
jgi:hypothetical protein